MKASVIKKLKSEKRALSERQLSEDLNLPVPSIKKQIDELRSAGYNILYANKGYHLTNEPDVLFPWEFDKREPHIHYFTEIESTMDIARRMAKNQCPHFTVVIADRQTKGRGRLKREWFSENGGLYFTIVLRPDVSISTAHIFNFAASLSLARILQDHYALNAKVKWPNDILVDGKKISGLLSEMEVDRDRIVFINIGIGINVNNDPTTKESNATSLKFIVKENVLRKTILSMFLDEFENTITPLNGEKIMRQWKEYTMTLGKEVRVVTSKETTEGTALDVDESGALILKLKDGIIKQVIYGDCFIQ